MCSSIHKKRSSERSPIVQTAASCKCKFVQFYTRYMRLGASPCQGMRLRLGLRPRPQRGSLYSAARGGFTQWRNNGVGRVGKVQGPPSVRGPRVPNKKIITVKYRHNYSHHRMFRCSIAAANIDKLQFKFKFYSYVMWNCVDDKKR